MSEKIFENIIKNTYHFENDGEDEKKCAICGEPIGDFDDNNTYCGEYCEECFYEAEESRLG